MRSFEAGARLTFTHRQRPLSSSASTKIGAQMRFMDMPVMRSETSSLSAERRPNTSRIAVRKAQGMVKMSENGMTSVTNSKITDSGSSVFPSSSSSFLYTFPSTITPLRSATPMSVADPTWRPR